MNVRLFEHSPAWVIEDDTLVGFDLSFTQGLTLRGIDPVACPDDELEGVSAGLATALSTLPDGTVLRLVSACISSYRDRFADYGARMRATAVGDYVARKKVAQCAANLSPLRRELMCFVSTPSEMPFNGYVANIVGRRAARIRARATELHASRLGNAGRLRRAVARELSANGVQSEPMLGADLFAHLWRLANPSEAERPGPPGAPSDAHSIRSQLFARGVVNAADHFVRGGRLHRVVTLRVAPRFVQPLQILELASFPFSHITTVTLRRFSDGEAQHRVEAMRRQGHEWNQLLAKVRGAQRNSELPDHEIVKQQADSDDVLVRLSNGEKLYDVAVHIWFSAGTAAQLEQRTDFVCARVRSCGHAEGAVEEPMPHVAFLGMQPGHHAIIGDRFHPMLASRAADMLPVFDAWQGCDRATSLLTTRRGELVGLEPFSKELQAWNATIAGGTGSGKSFSARTLLTGWLSTGGRVVVATRGTDYRRFAEVLGGRVYDVCLDDPTLRLGPFPPRDEVVAGGRCDPAVVEHLSTIIGLMASESTDPLSRQARRLIFRATETLYAAEAASSAATAGVPNFDDWTDALRRVARGTPDDEQCAVALVSQLGFWLDGPYGGAFRRQRHETPPGVSCGASARASGVDGSVPSAAPAPAPDDRLSVWNLAAVTDADALGVVLGMLSAIIATSIKAGPTIVVMDEVWALLRSPAGASLVETLYRTVRKDGSAIWAISQSMNDFMGLPEGCRSAVLNNSPIKMFLPHDASELDLVRDTFRLNERESQLLGSLRSVPGRYSEMLLFFGLRRQVLQLAPTGIEYWLATSHPSDVECEKRARRRHPSMPRFELLKKLARRYPHGALDAADNNNNNNNNNTRSPEAAQHEESHAA